MKKRLTCFITTIDEYTCINNSTGIFVPFEYMYTYTIHKYFIGILTQTNSTLFDYDGYYCAVLLALLLFFISFKQLCKYHFAVFVLVYVGDIQKYVDILKLLSIEEINIFLYGTDFASLEDYEV